MNIIGVDDYVKFPKYRPSKTQPYMREYYSELTTSEISQLYEIFELDFKLFGYDRLPGPLEKLIKNTTVSEKTNQENRKDKQFIVCLFASLRCSCCRGVARIFPEVRTLFSIPVLYLTTFHAFTYIHIQLAAFCAISPPFPEIYQSVTRRFPGNRHSSVKKKRQLFKKKNISEKQA